MYSVYLFGYYTQELWTCENWTCIDNPFNEGVVCTYIYVLDIYIKHYYVTANHNEVRSSKS